MEWPGQSMWQFPRMQARDIAKDPHTPGFTHNQE
jgi:hypothetical protein